MYGIIMTVLVSIILQSAGLVPSCNFPTSLLLRMQIIISGVSYDSKYPSKYDIIRLVIITTIVISYNTTVDRRAARRRIEIKPAFYYYTPKTIET